MNIAEALIVILAVIAVFYVLFRRDPWIERLEATYRPDCYGTWPFRHPQTAAERDCRTCPFGHDCFDASPAPHRGTK